jgi:hypothetical protein
MKPKTPESIADLQRVGDVTNPTNPQAFVTENDLYARTFCVEVKLGKHGKTVIRWTADCQLPLMTLEGARAVGAEVFGRIYMNQSKWELE